MGFWPPYTVPRSAAPATGVVSGPANWLVEHPVTRADTQQSSAAIAALLEVIPQIRFIILSLHGFGNSFSQSNGQTNIFQKPLRAKVYTHLPRLRYPKIKIKCGGAPARQREGLGRD